MARNKRSGRKSKNRDKPRRTKEEWEEMKKQNPELGKGAYKLAPKTNPTFEKFYQGIGIVPEEEWDTFLQVMRTELPATFRITGSRSQAQELLKIIKGQYFTKFLGKERDGIKMEPQPIPWYPDELAWQLDITKKQIKNDSTLKSLHGFLISETESGNISRQEAVSMIPPLLMDIEPHHKILDMCAAPGSKTAQLIEMLHSDENQPIPEGFVVANDMDNKRCYLMTHQVKRIQSPNCMIINHDARILPNMSLSLDEDAEFLRYDRILCDVPCSGDGTMRKNPDIWSRWHVNGGYNLHRIQKKVLQRGLELLAVGGKLVYSTCSLNPVEDEAVILALIKQCRGTVELLDVSDKLPGLKYNKGTYSWKILAKDGSWYETLDQAPVNFRNAWDGTMYPPIITEAQDAKLERCVRILPHQQNTGAFFIAVLQKTQELPWSHKRQDPVINPQLKLDEAERKDPLSEHFSFDVRCGSGLYMFAKCNLCGVLLQGLHDYNSHKQGRKHTLKLNFHQARTKEQTNSESVNDSSQKTASNGDVVEISVTLQFTDTSATDVTADTSADCDKASENDSSDKTEPTPETKESSGNNVKAPETDSSVKTEPTPETKEASGNDVKALETDSSVKTEPTPETKEASGNDVKAPETDSSDKTEPTPETKEASGNDDKAPETDSSDKTEPTKEATEAEAMETDVREIPSCSAGVKREVAAGTEEGQGDQDCSPPPAKKTRKECYQERVAAGDEIKVKVRGHKEDPFYFCALKDPIWPGIKEFYKLSDDLNVEQMMYRNMKRVLYFVSKPVRQLVITNHHKVKFINLGVKCFSNAPSPLVPDCDYRLSQEGLLAIKKYIGARRVSLNKLDLVTILSQENPFICKLSSKAQDDVYSMGPGSALFHFQPSESDLDPNVEIAFCGWRGKTSVRSFVGKDERSHYLRMCGVELTDIQAKVQAEKVARGLGASVFSTSGTGTDTPLGVPSGDEEEVTQWNEGQEAPRGMEEDETEENEGKAMLTGDGGDDNDGELEEKDNDDNDGEKNGGNADELEKKDNDGDDEVMDNKK